MSLHHPLTPSLTHPKVTPIDPSILKEADLASSERTTHKANCHCGTVRYSVTLASPFPKYKINRCTCSICTKNGYLLVYPCRKDIVFTHGYSNLSEYYFGNKQKAHKFCKTCGSSILIDFKRNEHGETDPSKDILAVNVRLFADVDFDNDDLEYTFFDGRNKLLPQYRVEDMYEVKENEEA